MEIANRTEGEIIEIDAALRDELLARALELSGGIYKEDLGARGAFLQQCQTISEALTDTPLGAALLELRSGARTAIVMRGLPVDPVLPPAPLDGGIPHGKKTFVSEAVAAGTASTVGEPTMIEGEKNRQLVHQITPVPTREHTHSNEGTVFLGGHQDMAPCKYKPNLPYDKLMPDWLILTGLQQGSGATGTCLASVDDALQHVSSRSVSILQGQRFVTDPPESFLKEMRDRSNVRPPIHAVLTDRGGVMESAYDSTSNLRPVDPQDHEANSALDDYASALARVGQEVVIKPGVSVMFNNRRSVHWRGSVHQEQDTGLKRWLQRFYVVDTERFAYAAAVEAKMNIAGGGGYIAATDGSAYQPDHPMYELVTAAYR